MSRLAVPERIRGSVDKAPSENKLDGSPPNFTWFIEISSQVIFSTTAAVHFELLVSRDEKSLELGFAALTSHAAATPGQLEDHQQTRRHKSGSHGAAQPKGVYSHAVNLIVDDTDSLWNKPSLPEWREEGKESGVKPESSGLVKDQAAGGKVDLGETDAAKEDVGQQSRKRKRIHLVVLTHGLHSNLGADMLYLKESIDAAAKKSRDAARKRKREERDFNMKTEAGKDEISSTSTSPLSGGQDDLRDSEDPENENEEEVIVRGFPGNACRTEKGIQYLGKRLAKWILQMTYPDQPFLPAKKSVRKKLSRVFSGDLQSAAKGTPEHKNSSIYKPAEKPKDLAYKITSISFIGHSLGGLTQTYAIAYINKHSPKFFDEIKPINFVGMAAPWLGLSNENPLYVKFALDFGLVGRTGQDLGLTWKSSTALRGGWDSIFAGTGNETQRAQKQADPGSKPLLRILPTGHTHHVLKRFRNRTVYSNVVNDGIVPLRTSCMLFLDWSGLGRVEKARRDNGLVAGLAGWGWAELTGANASSRHLRAEPDSDAWSQSNASGDGTRSRSRSRDRRPASKRVPPTEEASVKDAQPVELPEDPQAHQFLDSASSKRFQDEEYDVQKVDESPFQQPSAMAGFLALFRPGQTKNHHHSPKNAKIYKRSQTVKMSTEDVSSASSDGTIKSSESRRPNNVRGNSILGDPNNVFAPPRTTILESAGDILNPPLPSKEYLTDPKSRPRTIFHDRIYHPDDIPPPPAKKPPRLIRSASAESKAHPLDPTMTTNKSSTTPSNQLDVSGMKVEEKIARSYHHNLSWRKVLVRLEPDAHNNMVVRRQFANAYGWPVIKHLVDTHFADTYEATTSDTQEPNSERAKPVDQPTGLDGEETKDVSEAAPIPRVGKEVGRTNSELQEVHDSVPELKKKGTGDSSSLHSSHSAAGVHRPTNKVTTTATREDSLNSPSSTTISTTPWDDLFENSASDDDDLIGPTNTFSASLPPNHQQRHSGRSSDDDGAGAGTSEGELSAFLKRGKPKLDTARETLLAKMGDVGGAGGAKSVASPKSTTSLGLGKSVEERLGGANKAAPLRDVDVRTGKDGEEGGKGESA